MKFNLALQNYKHNGTKDVAIEMPLYNSYDYMHNLETEWEVVDKSDTKIT